jgi:hypothetical protein
MSAVLLPRFRFGAKNLRVVEVVSRDEYYVAGQLWRAWQHKLPVYDTYGDLYWNIGFAALLAASPFRSVDQSEAIVTLRLVSLACFLLIGFVGYLWGRRLTSALGGFAFSSLLFMMISAEADSVNRIVCCQPDMLNLLVSLAAFFACMELAVKLSRTRLLLAATTAGLVMAVKHSGFLFLLLVGLVLLFHAIYSDEESLLRHADRVERPLLVLHYVIGTTLLAVTALVPLLLHSGHTLSILPIPPGWPRLLGLALYDAAVVVSCALLLGFRTVRAAGRSVLNRVGFLYTSMATVVVAFLLAFVVSSPSSLQHARFASGLTSYAGVIHRLPRPVGGWIRLMVHDLPGPFPVILILMGASIVIYGAIKSGLRRASKRDLASLIWVALTGCFFLVYVGFVQHRFLFPVLPAMCWLAVLPILKVDVLLRKGGSRTFLFPAAIVILTYIYAAFLVRAQIGPSRARFSSLRHAVSNSLESEPGYQAGKWMDANLPDSTSIMWNFGVYLPPRFVDVHFFDVGDPYRQVEQYNPEVVAINTQETLTTARLPDEAIEQPVFWIPIGTVRKFYADLFAQRLGFKQVVTFSDSARGFDVVILRREGRHSDFHPEASPDSTDSAR